MKKMKIKRLAVTAVLVLVCYLLQCTVFSSLELAGIKPNLMIIATSSIGFMRGSKEGMLVGFFSGLFIDIQFGTVIGMYALIYMLTGYVNGRFMQMYYDEDIKLPICLIAASEFIYGLIVYFLMFMLRSEFQFWFLLKPYHHSGTDLHHWNHDCAVPIDFVYQPPIGSGRKKECK